MINDFFSFLPQLSSSEVDLSIDQTLGSFYDAAPLFGSDTKLQSTFIGITTHPTTPIATRQMPPLVFPQPKQSSSAYNSNGISSSQSSVINSSSRTYNNNNNNTINNNTAISNVSSYQQKSASSSSSGALTLAPPPQSRANSSNITSSNINTFVRPPDNKPLINGRSSYTSASQSSKHEVNKLFPVFW